MAARMVQLVRDESGLAIKSGCSELVASNYTRVTCAEALLTFADTFSRVSVFLLPVLPLLSMVCPIWTCRFTIKSTVFNFHVLAIPLYNHHTGEHMFDVLVQFLDAVYSQWRDILVGC
jgi:hypothetical protein